MAGASSQPGSLGDELGKRGAFESAEQEAFLNLMRTTSVLLSGFQRLFREHGVSEPLYNVLRILAGAGAKGRRCEQIAADMVARDPDVTRLVDRLVKAGLAERERSDVDRRVVIVRITDDGRVLLRQLNPKVAALHKRQLGHMGADRLARLSALLTEARRPS